MNQYSLGISIKKAANAAFFAALAAFPKLLRNTGLSGFCACLVVFLVEFLDTSGGIHDFLCACVERMAFRADFNMQSRFAQCGLGVEFIAAAAGNSYFGVLWVCVGFHLVSLVSNRCGKKYARMRGADYP
jgi:hypothetical protein